MPKPRRRIREPYLKPRFVPQTKKPKRGEIQIRHVPLLKAVKELNIAFFPDGSVRVPRYRQLPSGEIELAGYLTTRTPYDAIRQTAHTIESIEFDLPRMQIAQQNLASLHSILYNKWKEMNPKQREKMKAYVYGLIDYIQQRRKGCEKLGFHERKKIKRYPIYSPDKINAVKRIEKAIELMEKGNIGAARAALAGASNDLIARMNTLIRQSAFLRRRRKSILRERVLNEIEVFNIFNALGEVREKITAVPEFPRELLINSLNNSLNGIKTLKYKRFERAEIHISRAIELLQKRAKTSDIRRALTNAMNTIYLTASECTVFSMERLKKLKEMGGPITKMTVVRNQARLFAENTEYWFKKARPEQKKNMYAFLRMLSSTLVGTKAQAAVIKIAKAERALRNKKAGECKNHLLDAVKLINDKLKEKKQAKK